VVLFAYYSLFIHTSYSYNSYYTTYSHREDSSGDMLRYLLAKTRPPLPHSITSHVQTRALSSITGTGFRPSNPLTHSHTHSHTHSNKGEAFYHITNTINNFLLCMDYNKSDEFARLFTHSATCEVVKSAALVTGRDSLKLLCENLHSRFSPALHMVCDMSQSLNHPLTHLLTHSLTQSLTHSHTHTLTHSLTHPFDTIC
jgi:hypothetical protein